MKNWFSKNLKNIIIGAFVVPILLVAFVSISHVTSFYGISNPITWAIYLSVGIEIAALSALAAVSVNMGRFVYLPFFIVTLIQMLGNIFFSFTFIDETSQTFQDWISMVGGLFENMGVEKTDLNTHKTILSFLTGGLLPIISLTFAHMLVKFSEKENKEPEKEIISVEEASIKIARDNYKEMVNNKWTPSQEEIETLEKVLNKTYNGPVEKTNEASPYTPTEKDLTDLQNILSKYLNNDDANVEESIVSDKMVKEFIETDNEILDLIEEPKIDEIVSEIKEVFEEVKTEEISEIEEVKNEEIIETEIPTQENIEDKKKTDDIIETEKNDDYKVLSYSKRNG